MHDEDGIANDALRVALWLTQRPVMDSKLRHRFAGPEPEILQNEVTFGRNNILGFGRTHERRREKKNE